MKIIQFLFPAALLFTLSAASQDTITYAHCNCVDIIDALTPAPNGAYKRVCNNQIIETGNFANGLKTGEWLSYNTLGGLIKTINYSNGTLNGDVSYFYNTGKKKLQGTFSDGVKNGDWKFYSQKEVLQWSLSFNSGIPTGKSLVYDRKGKKPVIIYNYDTKNYDLSNDNFSLFEEDAEVLQDPTSSEWFILMLSEPTSKTRELSLDEENVESELFLSLIEIPSEILNTYLNVNYNAKFTFENYGVKSIELKRESAKGEEYPLFSFAVMTNDPDKLHKVEPSEFTLMLLDTKIKEALSIFNPWQIESGDFNIAFLYVVNEIEGREEIDKY